jgi:hypothetical protein
LTNSWNKINQFDLRPTAFDARLKDCLREGEGECTDGLRESKAIPPTWTKLRLTSDNDGLWL